MAEGCEVKRIMWWLAFNVPLTWWTVYMCSLGFARWDTVVALALLAVSLPVTFWFLVVAE